MCDRSPPLGVHGSPTARRCRRLTSCTGRVEPTARCRSAGNTTLGWPTGSQPTLCSQRLSHPNTHDPHLKPTKAEVLLLHLHTHIPRVVKGPKVVHINNTQTSSGTLLDLVEIGVVLRQAVVRLSLRRWKTGTPRWVKAKRHTTGQDITPQMMCATGTSTSRDTHAVAFYTPTALSTIVLT